ncbi:hypothetical protein [Chitinophaga qingshengii]|uniref:Uncharacterized protein n=1 Tax=Chitinophaga qingshengii TaxID=1569794 RepID=A0ABR7TSR4_9BACT|nr:hypothetical protein [Chitinophaga qingshengii]MBC9932501.1 hypothetical protein [Chitinophaga qingshengii]
MLAEAMNTYNIALYTIREKGYTITTEQDEAQEEITSWIAVKGEARVSAFTPLSLLALVVVFEEYGVGWKQIKTGNLYEEILEQ